MRSVLFVFLMAVLAAAQDETGKITGVVVDAITHQPLKKVTVVLMVPYIERPTFSVRTSPAITDTSGAFTFDKLKPGPYSLNVTSNDSSHPMGKTVKANASENPEPLTVEMMPGAAMSGRILDEDGDPMSGCTLQLYIAGYSQGLLTPRFRVPVGRSGYRLTGLMPEKYLVSAQCDGQPFQPRPFSAGPDPPASLAYPVQFYPDTPDMASAEPVELTAGVEKVGIDLRMRPAHVTQVRVSLAVPGTTPIDGAVDIKLIPAKDSAEPVRGVNESTEEGGRFEFPRVFPGSYLLVVTTVEFSGAERIEVKDRPVNATIQLSRGVDISGGVEVESGSNREQMRLLETSFRFAPDYPEFPLAGISLPQQRFGKEAEVKEDGSFTLKSVAPGEWRLQVTTPAAFVKSAWLGSTDVTGQPFVLNGGVTGALRIVLSGNTGTIRGTASPGDFVQVISIGVPGQGGPGPVDQSGQFRIEGLVPGKYLVGTMQGAGGQEVTVREGETVTVDLRN